MTQHTHVHYGILSVYHSMNFPKRKAQSIYVVITPMLNRSVFHNQLQTENCYFRVTLTYWHEQKKTRI